MVSMSYTHKGHEGLAVARFEETGAKICQSPLAIKLEIERDQSEPSCAGPDSLYSPPNNKGREYRRPKLYVI